jgi:hypothetical protein
VLRTGLLSVPRSCAFTGTGAPAQAIAERTATIEIVRNCSFIAFGAPINLLRLVALRLYSSAEEDVRGVNYKAFLRLSNSS